MRAGKLSLFLRDRFSGVRNQWSTNLIKRASEPWISLNLLLPRTRWRKMHDTSRAARPTKSISDFYLGRCQPQLSAMHARSLLTVGSAACAPIFPRKSTNKNSVHPMHPVRTMHAPQNTRVIPMFYGIARSVKAPYEGYVGETWHFPEFTCLLQIIFIYRMT